jgi:hypothetical protein
MTCRYLVPHLPAPGRHASKVSVTGTAQLPGAPPKTDLEIVRRRLTCAAQQVDRGVADLRLAVP